MYYTFFFNVDAVVCQNNGQFQVWELNIWQFIEYYLPIFILSIHFREISFFKITKDIQNNNNNTIVLSMLYAEICPKVRRHNELTFGSCIMPCAEICPKVRRHKTWTTQYYCIIIAVFVYKKIYITYIHHLQ